MSTPLQPLQPLATPQDWALNYQLPSDIEQPIASARPSTGSTIPTPFATSQPTATTASTPAQTPSQTSNVLSDVGSLFGGTFSKIPGIIDIVAILAGLVLLVGAVFGFKNIANTTVKVAGDVAKAGAAGAGVAAAV